MSALWPVAAAFLIAVFFVVGGGGNIFATQAIVDDYVTWGYPAWFHYVTGVLELVAAALILVARTRFLGLALAAAIMVAALLTLLVHGDLAHAIAPAVVLTALAVTGAGFLWRARRVAD